MEPAIWRWAGNWVDMCIGKERTSISIVCSSKEKHMSKFINWIDDKKRSTYVLSVLLFCCYAGMGLFPASPAVALAAFLGSITVPFLIALIWLIDNTFIDKLLNRRWTAIFFAAVVIVYGMFANTFSSSLINELFGVDPTHFTVTSIFLTTIYLLIGIFQPFVIFPIWLAMIVISGVALPVLLVLGTGLQPFKRIGLFLSATIVISVASQTLGIVKNELPTLAEMVALHTDFHEKHRCTAIWTSKVDKVVFLADGNVLAHVSDKREYEVLPCFPR